MVIWKTLKYLINFIARDVFSFAEGGAIEGLNFKPPIN